MFQGEKKFFFLNVFFKNSFFQTQFAKKKKIQFRNRTVFNQNALCKETKKQVVFKTCVGKKKKKKVLTEGLVFFALNRAEMIKNKNCRGADDDDDDAPWMAEGIKRRSLQTGWASDYIVTETRERRRIIYLFTSREEREKSRSEYLKASFFLFAHPTVSTSLITCDRDFYWFSRMVVIEIFVLVGIFKRRSEILSLVLLLGCVIARFLRGLQIFYSKMKKKIEIFRSCIAFSDVLTYIKCVFLALWFTKIDTHLEFSTLTSYCQIVIAFW